jgi:ribulose 1,5-bisphosphate synthetase/thiazole synthase
LNVEERNAMSVSMDVDVLVAGGGPAGIGAAVAASRLGARTLLVERMGFLGGVAAVGLGMPINEMRPGGKPRSEVHEFVINHVERYGEEAFRWEEGRALVPNTEFLKLALFETLEDVGCGYLLYCLVSDALIDDGVVEGVVVSGKGGDFRVIAKRVVDATGDGDVCFYAGCRMAKGREEDGFLSPMTTLFVLGGVDVEKALTYEEEEDKWFLKVLKEGWEAGYEVPDRIHIRPTVYPGSLNVNHAGTKLHGVFDGTDVRDLTRAEEQVGAWAGVRETRRIIGGYVLTEEDAKRGARFPDVVARRYGRLDIGFVRILEEMKPHDVPYRALVPNGVENILGSGRNISATHVGVSAGKSMGNCMATGHAAGVAAALSVQKGVSPRELDVGLVQKVLREDGVNLG